MTKYSNNKMHYDNIKKMYNRYRAQVCLGKPTRKYEPKPFLDPWLSSKEDFKTAIDTEMVDTVDINMDINSFNKMVNELEELDSHDFQYFIQCIKIFGERFMDDIQHIKWKEDREQRIRNDYPGVQKAWDNYQLMLKLASGHNS